MSIQSRYSWTAAPLICSAPMLLIAGPALAVEVSKAYGFGFIAAGIDLTNLRQDLHDAAQLIVQDSHTTLSQYERQNSFLPIGVGIICHSADIKLLEQALQGPHRPRAVWLFGPTSTDQLQQWSKAVRAHGTPSPDLWIQVGSVADALDAVEACHPDVLVIQGTDAGGHGLNTGAGIISLVPEIREALEERKDSSQSVGSIPYIVAAGGIADGRGIVAACALGAEGIVMGTRFLASHEAKIAEGYQNEVIQAKDGGQTTKRTIVYDTLRGTTGWPAKYGGRGILNQSYNDWEAGMNVDENRRLYDLALHSQNGWGDSGRLAAYASTSVGLIKDVQHATDIVKTARSQAISIAQKMEGRISGLSSFD